MALNNYQTVAQYEAATPSTTESTISHVEETNEVHINGVNVVTDQPKVGDAVYFDSEGARYFVAAETINTSLISSDWTLIGHVFFREGNKCGVINKTASDEKFCDVLQFTISAITDTAIAITLKDKTGTDHTINVTLTAAAIGGSSAAEIDAAIRAAAIDDQDWHAYLSTNGTGIIIQCDTWTYYSQYQCSMTGGTIAFTTWGDMPAASSYWKNDGGYTNYRGIMNVAKGVSYFGTNGRTPTATEPVVITGNNAPVTSDAFENSEYCADLRSTYGTYDNYIRDGYGVMCPQNLGVFAIDVDTMCEYALETAPTIGGETKYKYPAMAACALIEYNCKGFELGDWYLPDVFLGCKLMNDDTIAALKVGTDNSGATAISNATTRWLLGRYGVGSAWFYGGGGGPLFSYGVHYKPRAQAVVLLDL